MFPRAVDAAVLAAIAASFACDVGSKSTAPPGVATLVFSSNTLVFPDTLIGRPATLQVTVTNLAQVPGHILSASDLLAPYFLDSPASLPATVAALSTITLTFRLQSAAAGAFGQTFALATDDPALPLVFFLATGNVTGIPITPVAPPLDPSLGQAPIVDPLSRVYRVHDGLAVVTSPGLPGGWNGPTTRLIVVRRSAGGTYSSEVAPATGLSSNHDVVIDSTLSRVYTVDVDANRVLAFALGSPPVAPPAHPLLDSASVASVGGDLVPNRVSTPVGLTTDAVIVVGQVLGPQWRLFLCRLDAPPIPGWQRVTALGDPQFIGVDAEASIPTTALGSRVAWIAPGPDLDYATSADTALLYITVAADKSQVDPSLTAVQVRLGLGSPAPADRVRVSVSSSLGAPIFLGATTMALLTLDNADALWASSPGSYISKVAISFDPALPPPADARAVSVSLSPLPGAPVGPLLRRVFATDASRFAFLAQITPLSHQIGIADIEAGGIPLAATQIATSSLPVGAADLNLPLLVPSAFHTDRLFLSVPNANEVRLANLTGFVTTSFAALDTAAPVLADPLHRRFALPDQIDTVNWAVAFWRPSTLEGGVHLFHETGGTFFRSTQVIAGIQYCLASRVVRWADRRFLMGIPDGLSFPSGRVLVVEIPP